MDSKRLCLALVLVGLSFGLALGQGDRATVVGTVTDSTGAVIPGAEVYMTQVATNQVHSSLSSDTGQYAISALPADVYEMRVTMPGFKTEVRSGLKMDVGQSYRIDIELSVGEVAEVVEVASTAPILKTETAEFGQVIDNKKIINIPLNQRDVFGVLGGLTPGVQPLRNVGGVTSGVAFNVRGMRRADNNATLDGSQMSETNGSLQFFANPDAIQEFEVKSGLYGAEYGIKPGGQFSAVTKSGTNELHGTIFWFHRNDNLDARNFFDTGPKNEFKRNQFGAVAGGPVMFPGLYDGRDQSWWFFAYSGERIRQFRSLTATVPTPAERGGTFSSTIMDPTTGEPFPNNTIPANRIAPQSKLLGDLWPTPNTDISRGFNYTSASNAPQERNEYIVRMDIKTGDDSRWFGRFLFNQRPITFVNVVDAFTVINGLDNWAQNVVNTRNFGPTVVNELGLHFYRRPYNPGFPPGGPDLANQLNFPNWPKRGVDLLGTPTTIVTGYPNIGSRGNRGPVPEGQWELKENVSWTKGNHYLKAGYHYRYHYVFFGLERRSILYFNTPSRYAGNALANFYLGYLTRAREGSEARLNHNFPGHYIYLQDSWKATPKLTLQLGLRYELRQGWEDKRGFSTNLKADCALRTENPIPDCYSPALLNQTLVFPETGRFEPQVNIFTWTKNGFQPRLGLSYRLTDKTVLRIGGGIYGNEPPGGMMYGAAALGNPRPNSGQRDFDADAVTPNLHISNPFDESILVGATGQQILPGGGYEDIMPQWYVPNFGLSIQHRAGENNMFEVGYEGSRSVHEMQVFEFNDAVPGEGAIQPRRPWSSMSRYHMLLANGDQTYHGFNFKWEKRPGQYGLTSLLAFSWGKSLDTTGGRLSVTADPRSVSRNLWADGFSYKNRGRGEGNIPVRLAWLKGWDLPFGPGRAYGSDGFFSQIFGGWSVYAITTLQKGHWYTVSTTDLLAVGSNASQRPDLLRDPNSGSRRPEEWFRTDAFAAPSPGRYGNAGRGIVEGPGTINVDFSLLRDFYLGEETRIQFRFEAFNLTNHTNLNSSWNTFNFNAGSFGAIGAALTGRQLQFGLKIYY